MSNQTSLRERFAQRYGTAPRIFRAPGRVNLIGEHTDYNDGFVFPAAIEFYTQVAIAPRSDRKLLTASENYPDSAEIDLNAASPTPKKHWSDYVHGVALMLMQAGYRISGANLLIESNVPLGAGLSSSAALEVAVGLALLGISNAPVDRRQLALLCQKAENEFVGARCGIMDQFISCNAKADSALLLDCRSLDYNLFPLARGFSLIACNTMVKHDLATGAYNQRRAECEEAVRILAKQLPNVRALRDVSLKQLEQHATQLTKIIYRRCHHVISEDERVTQASHCLTNNDLKGFGKLMAESHRSLRDDYEVSCSELDIMVELANEVEGVLGARMTGGGFGGCTINLVRSDMEERFREHIAAGYFKKTGKHPEIYVSHPAAGAEEVTLPRVPVEI
jgi:galactokinase